MNGNGNDFMVLDNRSLKYGSEELSKMTVLLCRRRESIGADGVLIVEPSDVCDFKMRLFNRDGSEGEMCGNGARCIARFAFENGVAEKNEMSFETLGGLIRAKVNGKLASINLADVSLEGAPVDVPAKVGDFEFCYTFLNVGVPHAVIFQKDRDRSDAEYTELGRQIRNCAELFPNGTNVNFVFPRKNANSTIDVLTYERGVESLTLSCGTGSVASAIASVLIGLSGPEVDAYNPGGLNRVKLSFMPGDIVRPELEGRVLYVADMAVREEALCEA